jgi:alkylation response protein AidB-like acyl-CoA dehydrogenase
MDLSYTPEQEAFRSQLRTWLGQNVPTPALASPGTREAFEAHRDWERRLSSDAPKPSGVFEKAIFEEEYLRAGGPERITVVGQKLMAPTLLVHGTEDQKERWLPGIDSADEIWSQGFSEPGAGSDLAAIRTKAEPSGDGYVVNGQKIWTSYGAFADWIFVLARTDPTERRHRGISFFAVDMTSEGVEPRPIVQLDGHAGFAEVFFTDVHVPADQVIGDVGDGWRVAMTTLGSERDSPPRSATRYLRDLETLQRIASIRGLDRDPTVQDTLAKLYVEAKCYALATLHTISRIGAGAELGAEASVMKLQWSELERKIFETGVELLGPRVVDLAEPGDDAQTFWHNYWYARAATIYAGTSEIQRNIISERLLGLPR